MDIISASNISKTYRQGDQSIPVLCSIDFRVAERSFVSIIGRSGAGKSTLLHILGGLDAPDSGTVVIHNQDVYALAQEERCVFRRKNIGFLFQKFYLLPALNTYENIIFPLLLDGKKVDKRYFTRISGLLDINDRLNHYPDQLSGGEIQRVALARAIIHKPGVLFCDEPTGNLDDHSADQLLELIVQISREIGQTIVFVTHDPKITRLTDSCFEIQKGSLREV